MTRAGRCQSCPSTAGEGYLRAWEKSAIPRKGCGPCQGKRGLLGGAAHWGRRPGLELVTEVCHSHLRLLEPPFAVSWLWWWRLLSQKDFIRVSCASSPTGRVPD